MDKNIKKFTFLKKKSLFMRLDLFPFIVLHSIGLVVYTGEEISDIIKIILGVSLLLIQFVVFFSKFWSEKLRSFICFSVMNSITNSTHIRVDITNLKFKMNNRTAICDIEVKDDLTIIDFEKEIHYFDQQTQIFIKSKYNTSKPISEILKSKSLTTKEMENIKSKFGNNVMKIPIPSFFELYKEHMVAPFFVFQLFCILLWVVDDYGVHSAITLTMLCIFEATVVGQRIVSLVTLRKMRVPPHYIFVYRNNLWEKISSADLLPGDIVSVLDGGSLNTVETSLAEEEENSNLITRFLKKLKEMKKKAEEQRNQRSLSTVISKNKDKEPSPLTCDMVILSGSVIVNEAMLTGESVPQIKDSVNKFDYEINKTFDPKAKHKGSVIFAGTKVVKSVATYNEGESLPENITSAPPDNGAICLVFKTGFNTSQGKLLRTVIFSSERTKGDSKEAFVFIFFLLAVALVAAYYVYDEGIKREGKLTYKLLLRCIIIITSVVPAELPIELSLAINNSLLNLQAKKIVCIEPFRIPFAGKIDMCCFDKTGTLTKDEFIMKGVASPHYDRPQTPGECDENTLSILLGCNSLLWVNQKLVGDPIELVVFKSSQGTISSNWISSPRKIKMFPLKRYVFDSVLKRMSVLVTFYSSLGDRVNRILTKGAPETMKPFFNNLPSNYDECYNKYAKLGFRILAIGYKDSNSFSAISKRDEVEKDLTFCGFIIVETPLKHDTEKYMKELKEAGFDMCIITGDHHLTTAKVSQDCALGPDDILFLKVIAKKGEENIIETSKAIKHEVGMEWIDLDGKTQSKASSKEEIKLLFEKYTLGITGPELEKIDNLHAHILDHKHEIFPFLKLYCRVSPTQKDNIIKSLIKAGYNPSMCGDGSNDVGALKRAVIGVALLNSDEITDKKDKHKQFNILSLEDETTINSGDVTAAAPFTSKSGSIKCVKNIFIQGRCTLVITFQMFKILALNCFLTAYSSSILALKGIKFSDYQVTYLGFIVAFFFLMLSKAEPLKKISKHKPPTTILTLESLISIIGQAFCNLVSLYLIMEMTREYDPDSLQIVKSFDDPFAPTLMNSIIYIYTALNSTINFVVNYQGEPYMQKMSENKWLMRLIYFVLGISAIVIFDIHQPLNEGLELLPLPEDIMYKFKFIGIMACNFIISYLLENWKKLLGYYK